MTFDKSQSSYEALRSIIAERTNGVVFWIGSGPSIDAGLPSWTSLKEILLESLEEKAQQLNSTEVDGLGRAVELIKNEKNNWCAFELLRRNLGRTTWQSRIRELLDPPASIETPLIYKKIWKLRPHGILSLNLDRLVTKAHRQSNPDETLVTEFVGKHVAQHTHALKNPHSFICHLHGQLDDASSWILTSDDLERQKHNTAYRQFISTCLTAKTVVFLGIGADDQAVGGFFEQISRVGIDVNSHYWITHRRDRTTDRWAEEQGIRLILYNAPDENHIELLEMLDDLIAFVSKDVEDVLPVNPVGLRSSEHELPCIADLLGLDEEQIRQKLNSEAGRILETSSPDKIDEYNKFSQEYDQAMYRAWYTSTEPGRNKLLGHMLHDEVASGAFGKVYKATDPVGKDVAVKVLHVGIRQNVDLFQAFRRGVRSMQILQSNQVEGMVPYKQTFEIPACVVMDWIDGPDLNEAVSSKHIHNWGVVLRIGTEIADIVRRGHVLPERVLHRDIRPSNVMLRRFYTKPEDWDVVVLDFDLSWHRGALERSVVHGSTTFGYLAPEQIQDLQGVSTRHAAVDSFGIGMVLFFMMSGRNPIPDEHKHTDWKDTLNQAATTLPSIHWHSIPSRYARLIDNATQDKQATRWDMTQIQAELRRLYEAACDPRSIQSTELIAEEIAARCDYSTDYVWNDNTLSAVKDSPSGVRLIVRGDESQSKIIVELSWGDPGVQGRTHLAKWITTKMEVVRDILDSSGWSIDVSRSKYAHIYVSAAMHANIALINLDRTAKSLDRALNQLRF